MYSSLKVLIVFFPFRLLKSSLLPTEERLHAE